MMSLPFDILSENYVKPKLFLCEVDKTKICELETIEMSGSFKFNAYSELTFTVPRAYTNIITGETDVNPFYDKIEALRLVYLEGFGYFEIQEPDIESDGIREVKNVTAYSLEYSLSQKYLDGITINKGTHNSYEVINGLGSIVLYDPLNYSLTDLVLEKVYGWEFEVEPTLRNIVRDFDISRVSIYDFITQEICERFNCFAVFDTINNKIKLYAENLSTKFYGDGSKNEFELPTPYDSITVTIDGFRTNAWDYKIVIKDVYDESSKVGVVTFHEAPADNSLIEITDGSQAKWDTDIYIAFDNLAQNININYSAEDIKTVLTVKGSDDLDIRNVNMGLEYITDLSYYYSEDWMGPELYKVYTLYNKDYSNNQSKYAEYASWIQKLNRDKIFIDTRLSLEYTPVNTTKDTVGTYYVRVGPAGNCYYQEVKLPEEWKIGVTYYSVDDLSINEDKFNRLFDATAVYYNSGSAKNITALENIKDDFIFVEKYTIGNLITNLKSANSESAKDAAIKNFLDEALDQLGLMWLKDPYKKMCEQWKEDSVDMGNDISYTVRKHVAEVFIAAIDKEIGDRDTEIKAIEAEIKEYEDKNSEISDNLLLDVYFYNYYLNEGNDDATAKKKARELLIRLNPFLREDEYTDENFVVTELDDDAKKMKLQKELLECGKIELSRLCEPRLSFSMELANIYALPEFQPLVHHFQLGNLINVAIRDNYIKKARILGVNINFNDFSDFTCEFGELTSVRTPSSIHADLLASALQAGKSVASNASYWNKGINKVSDIELKIEQGLISMVGGLYNSDQSITIDDNGIWLRKVNEDGSFSPYQACLTSNSILMSTDGFKEGSVPKMGLGEFAVDGRTFYGILAEAVLSGYIEGCTIVGGTINIGNGAFVVHEDGSVTMNGVNSIAGYARASDVSELQNKVTITGDTAPSSANEGQLWLNTSTNPYSLMVYTNGEWEYFSKQDGYKVYTSKPAVYSVGDLWVLGDGEIYPEIDPIYSCGNILRADENKNWVDAIPYITNTLNNIQQYLEFNPDNGLKIGQKDEKFYVNIGSTRMSFYDKSDGEDEVERERDPDEVVYISNKSAVMKKLVVEDDAMFESPATFEQDVNIYIPDTTVGFSFKIEANGSFSLAVSS